MCLVNLALLTGNFGKPGSGVNPLRGQNNVQGAAHMGCEPGNLTGMVALDEGRTLFEEVWRAPVPDAKGLDLMQMMDAASDGKLKALWAIGYDIALTNPDANATAQSLKSLDFVIVQDMFLNELARECGHVFFPVASSFERDGTFMNSERRIQRVRKVIEAPGEAKADWEIICELAARNGQRRILRFSFAGRNLGRNPQRVESRSRHHLRAIGKWRAAMAVSNRRPSRHDRPAHEIFSERSARAAQAD